MQKARQSEFGRTRAAANCRVCFVNNNGTSRARQRDRRRETIRSRANDNRIASIRHELPVTAILEAMRASCELKRLQAVYHAQTHRIFRFISMERTLSHETEANFSIDEYGAKTAEKEECEEQLLAEYATLLGFFLTTATVLTGVAVQQSRLPRKFGLLDLALLGIATHKLSRIVAKDRITGILRAPFVCYIRSAGAGEVEEEPRGRGFQRGIGHLVSCPYCMAPWCATALAMG